MVYMSQSQETCTLLIFIATLNKIKDKTGLYIIVTALNCDWLEYAGGNTMYEDLIIVPNNFFLSSHK